MFISSDKFERIATGLEQCARAILYMSAYQKARDPLDTVEYYALCSLFTLMDSLSDGFDYDEEMEDFLELVDVCKRSTLKLPKQSDVNEAYNKAIESFMEKLKIYELNNSVIYQPTS